MPHTWNQHRLGWHEVCTELERIESMTSTELPFLAIIARQARDASGPDEFERLVASIYRLGLDHGHPIVPDIADTLLSWIEDSPDSSPTRSGA